MRACIDTNIFVYATYPSYSEHVAARTFLRNCLGGSDEFVLTWGIIYEYLRVVTHPKLFLGNIISFDVASKNVEGFCAATNVHVMSETDTHWDSLRIVAKQSGKPKGNILHDCHIVALMREHDVPRIYTADADFRLFEGLEVVDPLKATSTLPER